MRLGARLWNCNHVRLPQYPCERNLSGSGVMPLGDLLQRRVSQQLATVTDRRIRHGDLVRLAPRQKSELDLASLEIVQNLICCTLAALFERQQLLHIVDIEV